MIYCKEIFIMFLLVIAFSKNINGSIVPLVISSEDTEDLSNNPYLFIHDGRTCRRLYRILSRMNTKVQKRSQKTMPDNISPISWNPLVLSQDTEYPNNHRVSFIPRGIHRHYDLYRLTKTMKRSQKATLEDVKIIFSKIYTKPTF